MLSMLPPPKLMDCSLAGYTPLVKKSCIVIRIIPDHPQNFTGARHTFGKSFMQIRSLFFR